MPPKKSFEETYISTTDTWDRRIFFKLKKGDDVLMRPLDPMKPSRVARVEEIVMDLDGSNPEVYVRRFYRPEDSRGGRFPFHGVKEVFFSHDLVWESVVAIQGQCNVHELDSYTKLDFVRVNDFFYRYHYNYKTGSVTPDPFRFDMACTCKQPRNPDDLMVHCVQCFEWFHPSCIGITIDEARSKLNHFCCEQCSKQQQDVISKNSNSKRRNKQTN